LASTEDIWTPYKALYNTISKVLSAPDEFPSVVLEETLKSNKQTFLNLLKNSVSRPIAYNCDLIHN
jgi:hypothetical protein